MVNIFDGTAIIVSHDREFLDGLVTKVYEFGGGRVREHIGGIYDWLKSPLHLSPEGGVANDVMTIDERLSLTPSSTPAGKGDKGDGVALNEGASSYAERKEQQKKVKKVEKAVKACEEKIAQMEARIKEMDALLSHPEHATDMKLIEEYSQTMRQLDEENERWMMLSEELEAL